MSLSFSPFSKHVLCRCYCLYWLILESSRCLARLTLAPLLSPQQTITSILAEVAGCCIWFHASGLRKVQPDSVTPISSFALGVFHPNPLPHRLANTACLIMFQSTPESYKLAGWFDFANPCSFEPKNKAKIVIHVISVNSNCISLFETYRSCADEL